MTSTVFLSLLILVIGFILRDAIYKIKQSNIKEKDMYDIWNTLIRKKYILEIKSVKHISSKLILCVTLTKRTI